MNSWRSIPGFPAYEVTASGRVRSALTAYVLTPRKGIVSLQKDGKAHRCVVRDLVATAWTAELEAPAAPEVSDVKPLFRADRDELLDLAAEYDCLVDECARLVWENKELQADRTSDHLIHARLQERHSRMKVAFREKVGALLGRISVLNEREEKSTSAISLERAENARLLREIAKRDAKPAAQPAAVTLTADEKDEQIARLRALVAEQEAELAAASAGI